MKVSLADDKDTGFFLCEAGEVITVGVYRRLNFGILEKSLMWMAENRNEICGYYDWIAERTVFDPQISQITQISNHFKDDRKSVGFNSTAACCDGKDKAAMSHKIFIERMDMIDSLKEMPEKFLSEANIQYLAPADAADTGLPDASMDYHISTTVFEHISRVDIKRILKEAKRILKDDCIAIHFIDLSDHFQHQHQHQDNSITSINFLRYSEKEWDKIAGNEFAYCNRLRASDYLVLFKDSGFDVCRQEGQEDKEAREALRKGFVVDERFREYSVDELCVTQLRVAMRAVGKATGI